jgi:hypothetical protein
VVVTPLIAESPYPGMLNLACVPLIGTAALDGEEPVFQSYTS